MKSARTESEAYQRILGTARDLFYRNGYRATGINEIIEKSGVAKATFYAHFPSKDALALAYIRTMNDLESPGAVEALGKLPGPREKLLGILEFLIPWAQESDYRGCAYLNITSEMPDPRHPLREESRSHYDSVRTMVAGLLKDLKAEEGKAWKDRDLDKIADDFMLLFAGAIALAQVYHDPKPIRQAIASAKRLLA